MSKFAETPFALIHATGLDSRPEIPRDHPAVQMAKAMALTHNVILRSLNASYCQCLAVAPGSTQAADFLLFNQSLYEVLHIHHDVEEEFLFPEIQKLARDPHAMDANLQEHRAFHDGLARFQEYVFGTAAQDYSGDTLRELLQGFGKAVEVHLHHEIPTLLDLHVYDPARIAPMAKGMHSRTVARSNKYRHLPLFVGCADRTFKLDGQVEDFPKMPVVFLWLVRHFFEPRHAGVWRFNASDTYGQPRAEPVRLVSSK